jgi:5-methylcytosine-specific restriction endonuclease McrA
MATEWAVQMAESARRRMVELGRKSIVELVEPLEIFIRDSWVCQICYRPVNPKSIDPFDGQRATLDHRMPLTLGGAHSKSNLQTAHLSCNSSKGARPQAPN